MQIIIKESQIKVKFDYNKTCDNIHVCQQNAGTKRIYEKQIINK